MDMNYRGGCVREGVGRMEWSGGGDGTTVIAESINIFKKKSMRAWPMPANFCDLFLVPGITRDTCTAQ